MEQYKKIINILKSLYRELYIEMLDYIKDKVVEEYKELKYFELSPMIRKYYPQFSDNITLINVSLSNTQETYLDTIDTLLSTYLYFKNNYKLEYDTEKYKDIDVENLQFDDVEDSIYGRIYDEVHKKDKNE